MSNGLIFQYFHWYYPTDGSLWNKLKDDAEHLSNLGVTAVWLPPGYKGTNGGYSVGYDVYDVFDLGEFDQKGSVKTKYGNKEEYIAAVNAVHDKGMAVYADIVLNHMGGADEEEKVTVRRVNPDNRNEFISEPFEIEAFTKFTFPGRNKKYSDFVWNYRCFSGTDYAKDLDECAIFSIQNEYGEGWEEMVDDERGNYDYLMFSDIEFRNQAVREQLKYWGKWYYDTIHFDGVRLDAVKHISPKFYNEWLDYMRTDVKTDLFSVAEFWAPHNVSSLLKYIEATEGRTNVFDAPLQNKFHNASKQGRDFDLSKIFDDTLTAARPELSVTLVDTHDTQPLQALEAPVEAWFKPLAYTLILLREAGYPCVFYADLYSTTYNDKGKDGNEYEIFLPACENIEPLMMARKQYAHGPQRDYFDHANCIGWTREGTDEAKGSGCAVVLSNGDDGNKKMEIGKKHSGKIFIDLLKKHDGEIKIDEEGWAEFLVKAGTASVWVEKA